MSKIKSEQVPEKPELNLSESKNENDEKDEKNNEQGKLKSKSKLFLGCILAFLSGVFYTAQNAIPAKEQINVSEALIFRYTFIIMTLFVATAFCVEVMKCLEKKDKDHKLSVVNFLWLNNVDQGQNIHLLRGILISQGIFGGICILSDFHCVSNMPLGDASAIILSAPIPSMLLSAVFLGTRFRLYKIICGAILYSGVLLVIRPPFLFNSSEQSMDGDKEGDNVVKDPYFGALMGLLASVSRAAVFVCTKKLCQNKSSSSANLLTFHMSLTSLLFNLVWAGIIGDVRFFSSQIFVISGRTWLLYLAISILGATNLGLCNIAVKLANPILVSFVRSSDIIVAYLIQVIFFHEAASVSAIFGSVLIVFAVGILQLETKLNKLVPGSLRFIF